jgi:hypothetical protein
MSLLSIIIALVVIGVLLYCINAFIPMDDKVKKLLNLVVIVALVIWLLRCFGVFAYLSRMHF